MQFEIGRRAALVGAAAAGAAIILRPAGAWAAQPLTDLSAQGSGRADHRAFDSLLGKFVKPDGGGFNRVAYSAFKQVGHGDLKAYLAATQALDPTQLSRKEGQAYWINLYNAKTLDVVLDAFPVASIKQIKLGGGSLFGLFGGGPWSKPILNVSGNALSLDDVEHRIIRPLFGDPMSHYGLNCASYSCPNLMPRAYTGKNIGAQLGQSATEYVNHKRGVSVAGGVITASKIYSWYAGDFGGKSKLKSHWQKFATPEHAAEIAAASRIGAYEYDWALNDA